MSAYLELRRTGRLGPAGAEMLYRVTASAIHGGHFLKPGDERNVDDFVEETAHDYLTNVTLTTLFVRASDDASLERLIFAAVTNHLRDQRRQQGHGPLLRTLSDAVNDPDNGLSVVETVAGRAWTLPHVSDIPWAGRVEDLVAAAWSVTDVNTIRWTESARRSPFATRDSLVDVITAVIEEADGPVPVNAMREAVEHRFTLNPPPIHVDLHDEPAGHLPADSHDAGELVPARETARELFEQLSERERLALHYDDLSVRELAQHLEVGKSTAASVAARVREMLNGALADDDNPLDTMHALYDLIDDWT